MRVEIDLVANAASIEWGERARGRSEEVGFGSLDAPGKGVRLYLNEAGDVVGLEVLGWSDRAVEPQEVSVRYHTQGVLGWS